METALGHNDCRNLESRHLLQHFLMILLFNLLQFYIHLVTFTDNLGTGSLIGRFLLGEFAHTAIDCTLFLLHLTEDGKQTSCLLLGEVGLTGQKRLHVGLELLW